ncbi:MAG TPA: rRNA maturation RNase YbeY [Gammaproteobacteria bacterium]|jgi:probable rRNA maturation factor|nr:rRNA maturation RNase YbeY [Gammaproteobacteria bacterium]
MSEAPQLEVDVEDVSGAAGNPSAAEFQRWTAAALAGRREQAEVSIRIVGETEGAELNARYRSKTGPTNVLSFPAELPAGVPLPMVGDLVICAPVVAREAHAQGKEPSAHWAHLTVHGCLHLIGYDHEHEAGATEMEALETAILAGLGFPDPYTPA